MLFQSTIQFAFPPFSLTNGNSVVQIDPTSPNGVSSWTVDGIEQLFQQWFWLRAGSVAAQITVDATGGGPFGSALSSSNALVNYFAHGLQVNLGFTLAGGAVGSGTSQLTENISILNTTNTTISVHLYEYSDFDLAGQADGDTVSFPTSNIVVQQGKDRKSPR